MSRYEPVEQPLNFTIKNATVINKPSNVISKIVDDLGGVTFAVSSSHTLLGLAKSLFKDNKSYQSVVGFLQQVTPAAITGYKIYTSIQNYYQDKTYASSDLKLHHRLSKLLHAENAQESQLNYWGFEVGSELIKWLISKSITKNFKVLAYYNNNFDELNSIDESGNYKILIKYQNKYALIAIDIFLVNNVLHLNNCNVYLYDSWSEKESIQLILFEEFIATLDLQKNVIEYKAGYGISTRPRKNISFPINQFDITKFVKEINQTIKKQKRRGYLLVGPAGVGKSTIILKLEELLSNVPIVYINPVYEASSYTIRSIFQFVRSMKPCICIFEDFDTYQLQNKQDETFGIFIEEMDGLKHDDCVIIIGSLNEPKNLHHSLINRRGRFDRVIGVSYPTKPKEILQILHNKHKLEYKKPLNVSLISTSLINKIKKYQLTQSDLCEIIEYLYINDITLTSKSLMDSLNILIQTKQAIEPQPLQVTNERTLH